MSEELSVTREELSLTQLHEQLTTAGIDIAYSSLSQFINNGDIADQLGVGGKRNRRTFPAWSAGFLKVFLPQFMESKMGSSMAPDAMRHTLQKFRGNEPEPLRYELTSRHPRPTGLSPISPLSAQASTETALMRLADLLTERANAPEDRLLTAEEASYMLACSPRSVGRYVKSVLPRKWRQSDIQKYINGL